VFVAQSVNAFSILNFPNNAVAIGLVALVRWPDDVATVYATRPAASSFVVDLFDECIYFERV
jgi:hypothetical protein